MSGLFGSIGLSFGRELLLEHLEERIVLDGAVELAADEGTPKADMMDGVWHDLGDGTWYIYDYWPGYGYWWLGDWDTSLAYDYDLGIWWTEEYGSWNTVAAGGGSLDLFYDGNWIDLYNGDWFQYDGIGGWWWESQDLQFYYDYVADQWWAYQNNFDCFDYGGWYELGDPGAAADYVQNGYLHDLGGVSYLYDGTGSYWMLDSSDQFWYDWADFQWYQTDNGWSSWIAFDAGCEAGFFMYDGGWYQLESGSVDGNWFQYDYANGYGYWWSEGSYTYACDTNTDGWWYYSGGQWLATGLDDVQYVGSATYVESYLDDWGWTNNYGGYDDYDIIYDAYSWSYGNYYYEGGWGVYSPGSDNAMDAHVDSFLQILFDRSDWWPEEPENTDEDTVVFAGYESMSFSDMVYWTGFVTHYYHDEATVIGVSEHAGPDYLILGTDSMSYSTSASYQALFTQWGTYLESWGELQFYGCQVASTVYGEMLLDRIADWSGATVYGSYDYTGPCGTLADLTSPSWSEAQDWYLEYGTNGSFDYDIGGIDGSMTVFIGNAISMGWI
jgi:hypothetical protein